jgi:hypothetical protein
MDFDKVKIVKYWMDSSDEERRLFFATVTAFNINARYDDYKMTFQKTCTPEFTALWIERLKNQRLWIKKLIEQ